MKNWLIGMLLASMYVIAEKAKMKSVVQGDTEAVENRREKGPFRKI